MNPFIFSNDNKRYHTYNYYLRHTYHSKVYKVPLDAGFTCPNRDGTKGYGGCTFCSSEGSGEFTLPSEKDLVKQFNITKQMMEAKWPNSKAIAYFQSYSNTYGTLTRIKECVSPFLNMEKVVAIAIATRCDCLDEEKINYLNSLCDIKDIWIELGLQSSNEQTGIMINRGHDFTCFLQCMELLKNTKIKLCVHVINGLPYETQEDMLKTIKDIRHLRFDALKIHMLHISKNTILHYQYNKKPFPVLTLEDYVDTVIKQLELLPANIVIQRLTGDPVKEMLVEPTWVLNKTNVLNSIDKKMAASNTYQGRLYEKY